MRTEDVTHGVEGIYEILPDLHVTAALAFIIEAIHPRDIGALMIASKKEEVLRVLDLIAQKK